MYLGITAVKIFYCIPITLQFLANGQPKLEVFFFFFLLLNLSPGVGGILRVHLAQLVAAGVDLTRTWQLCLQDVCFLFEAFGSVSLAKKKKVLGFWGTSRIRYSSPRFSSAEGLL